MPVPAPEGASHPYRDGIVAGVGSALLAGLILGAIDVALTAGSAPGGLGFAPALLAFWAVPSVVLGVLCGLIAAGVQATWGPRALSRGLERLRADRDLDVAAAGIVLAAAVIAVLVIVVIGKLSVPLVGNVLRKSTGGLLLGIATVAVLPALALLGIPVFRVTRRVATIVPAIGAVPRIAVLLGAGIGAVVALALFFVFTQLDWQVLNLSAYGMLAALPVVTAVLALLGYGPLDGVRRRVPGRLPITAVGALAALALPVVVLGGTPTVEVRAAIGDHSVAGGRLLEIARGLIDRDGDGYSAFFDGPDCDDGNLEVNPSKPEIAGNGVDDNCQGGDRAATADAGGPATPPTAAAVPCGPTGPATPGGATAAARPVVFDGNFLFIVVDTVRADKLGAAGYQRDGVSLTPRLDELIARSTYFTRAYAQSPNTPRSMPSFMASRYPSQVLVDKSFANYPRVDDANELLFERLQAGGLRTLGVSSHFYFRPDKNIVQGFDAYDNDGALDIAPSNKDIASPRIVPKVIDQLGALAASKQRFAMFVHLFEPHSTYMEHEGKAITERGTAGLEQKYDYEIAYVDGWIGKILDALATTKLADNTMIVVMADHGEAFGVHSFAGQRMFFHGQTLYDELLRVPLIVHVPGAKPSKVDAVVQLIDVAPTVLDVLGLPAPATWSGRSLAPAIAGTPLEPRPAFAELLPAPSWKHEARAIISADGSRKLFHRISDKRAELYDLAADPQERSDLYSARPDDAKALEQLLLDFVEVTLPQ